MKRCKQPKHPRAKASQQKPEIVYTGQAYRFATPDEVAALPPLLKSVDVERLLGLSRKAVASLTRNGSIKAIRPIGYSYAIGYTAASVIQLLR
jgi:hypothetical protein